jgi:16S rRNA (uracil1498-N3)-methyltransferase
VDDALRRSAAHVLVGDVAVPELDDGSAHHLRRVLRLRHGESVTVTDGAGRWRRCLFDGDRVEADGDIETAPAPDPQLTVAVAPPKGDRLDWLVGKCTELGIDRLVMLEAERSMVRWNSDRAARQLDRVRRISVEAAMQSRRVWLPVVEGPMPAGDVLAGSVIAEPDGRPLGPNDTAVAVGPEGGWSPAELDLAAATVSLGPNVLRVETAAVAAAALMVSMRAPRDHIGEPSVQRPVRAAHQSGGGRR